MKHQKPRGSAKSMKPNSVFTQPYGYDQVYICSPNLPPGEHATSSHRSPFDVKKQRAAIELFEQLWWGQGSVWVPFCSPFSSRVLDWFKTKTGLIWSLGHFGFDFELHRNHQLSQVGSTLESLGFLCPSKPKSAKKMPKSPSWGELM